MTENQQALPDEASSTRSLKWGRGFTHACTKRLSMVTDWYKGHRERKGVVGTVILAVLFSADFVQRRAKAKTGRLYSGDAKRRSVLLLLVLKYLLIKKLSTLKKKKNQCIVKLKMIFYHRYKILGLDQ